MRRQTLFALLFFTALIFAKSASNHSITIQANESHACNNNECNAIITASNDNRTVTDANAFWRIDFDSKVSNTTMTELGNTQRLQTALKAKNASEFFLNSTFQKGETKQFLLSFKPHTRTGSWNATIKIGGISVTLDPTYINSCTTLDQADTAFELSQSISATGTDCIEVSAQNVSFDCAGFTITGDQTTGTTGIQTSALNTSISNCTVSNFYTGIRLQNSNNSQIFNATIRNSYYAALFFEYAHNNTFSNSLLENNLHGIILNNSNTSTIYALNISNATGNAVYLINSTSNTIYNSTISGTSEKDVQTNGQSNNTMLNTTFNTSNTASEYTNSYLNVNWYVKFSAINLSQYNLANAEVNYSNAITPSSISTATTGEDGLTAQFILTEFVQNSAGIQNYTPYSVNASISNHYFPSTTATNYNSLYLTESATKELQINGSWTIIYGNIGTTLSVAASTQNIFINWSNATATGTIYAIAAESGFVFNNVSALSRNTSNELVETDFNDLDEALGIQNQSDSITTLFSTSGTPTQTQNLTLRGNDVTYIPYINSTNSSNFLTGIVWDKSDGSPNYNKTSKSPIAFVTQVSRSTQGNFSVYDYELRVPRSFTTYKDGSQVDLYLELN